MLDFHYIDERERRVLVVDDEPLVHNILGSILKRLGFHHDHARNGSEAIQYLQSNPYTVVFADVNMPEMNGVELCRWIYAHTPDIATVIISGDSDLTTVIEVMQLGAYDYILKPFSVHAISISLKRTLEKRALIMENRQYQTLLEQTILSRTEELQRALTEAEGNFNNILIAFALALEMREHETQQHSIRVKEYSLNLARHLKLPFKDLINLEKGALLHDIGKIGVPDAILLKPSTLSRDEWEVMKQHPSIGARMLDQIESLRSASRVVRYHHERFDGAGYPEKARGEEIPIEARIFAIADTLDAMTSDRPYRRALTLDDAVGEIRTNAGKQFDPWIVDAFMSIPLSEFVSIREHIDQQAAV